MENNSSILDTNYNFFIIIIKVCVGFDMSDVIDFISPDVRKSGRQNHSDLGLAPCLRQFI